MATQIYASDILYASVCTDETDEAATAVINAEIPHFVPWIMSRRHFADGTPNPADCNHDGRVGHRHVLFTVLNEPEASPVPAEVAP